VKRSLVAVMNRLMAPLDACIVRKSYFSRLRDPWSGAAGNGNAAADWKRDGADGSPPGAGHPGGIDVEALLRDIAGILESTLNDAHIVGMHEASKTTANYILTHMQSARPIRSAFLKRRGDEAARFALLREALARVEVPGLYLEFGVHKGQSVNFIARSVPRPVYGFDSFRGLPEDWFFDQKQGTFDDNGQLPPVEPNVELVPGWFEETLQAFLQSHPGPVAFMHVDCDIYRSAAYVLETLRPAIVPGTVIVFDEYLNYPGWQEGEFKAFQQFVRKGKLGYEYLAYTPQWYSASVRMTAVESEHADTPEEKPCL